MDFARVSCELWGRHMGQDTFFKLEDWKFQDIQVRAIQIEYPIMYQTNGRIPAILANPNKSVGKVAT